MLIIMRKKMVFTKLKGLGTTHPNSSIAIMFMDPKLLLILIKTLIIFGNSML
jgi:hypothetical protein